LLQRLTMIKIFTNIYMAALAAAPNKDFVSLKDLQDVLGDINNERISNILEKEKKDELRYDQKIKILHNELMRDNEKKISYQNLNANYKSINKTTKSKRGYWNVIKSNDDGHCFFYTLKNFLMKNKILKEEIKEKIDFKNTDKYTKKYQIPQTIGDLRNYIMTRGNFTESERSAQEMCSISAAMGEGVTSSGYAGSDETGGNAYFRDVCDIFNISIIILRPRNQGWQWQIFCPTNLNEKTYKERIFAGSCSLNFENNNDCIFKTLNAERTVFMQNENGNHFNLLEPNLVKFLSTDKSVSKSQSKPTRRRVKVPSRGTRRSKRLESSSQKGGRKTRRRLKRKNKSTKKLKKIKKNKTRRSRK